MIPKPKTPSPTELLDDIGGSIRSGQLSATQISSIFVQEIVVESIERKRTTKTCICSQIDNCGVMHYFGIFREIDKGEIVLFFLFFRELS